MDYSLEVSQKFICEIVFKTETFLTKHTNSVHYENGTKFHCNICNKEFNIKRQLQSHIKVHESRKNFKCDICEKSFNKASTLKTHLKTIHDAQKDQNCDICSRSFSITGQLTQHIKRAHGK